jgi:hypothetical protein
MALQPENATASLSLIASDRIKCKVSSVLNNKKQFRKENMFDDSEESCWQSGPVMRAE